MIGLILSAIVYIGHPHCLMDLKDGQYIYYDSAVASEIEDALEKQGLHETYLFCRTENTTGVTLDGGLHHVP